MDDFLNPVTDSVAVAMPAALKANCLSLEALGVWFTLCLLSRTTQLPLDDEKTICKAVGIDPRVWRRCRAEMERHGVIAPQSAAA